MAKRIGGLFASLVGLSLFNAEIAPASSNGQHFVWRITGGAAPIYLIGSLHALRGTDYPLPEIIDHAIQSSRRVLFEINPDRADATLLERKLSEAGTYPVHVTLEQKVSPKTFSDLKKIARVRLSEYEKRKPWAIAYFMLEHRGAKDFNTRLSIDRYIYNRARGHSQIGGLETAGQFIQSLAGLSDAESETFLLEAIDYGERCPELLIETGVAWRSGDAQRMYRLYASRARRVSGYWNWLERRQVTWLPRIEAAIKSGEPTMIVVGALHFTGPHSLLVMLRARGYQIEQI
jgi:uncharacterized protein